MTKSKLGRQTISPKKEKSVRDSLECFEECQSEMAKSKNFYFEREQSGGPALSHNQGEGALSINP
jgi:hypothetical protein